MHLTSKGSQVHGTVATGFESVKALYERRVITMAEENTQLCVYHQGEKVVDLWCAATDDGSFSADSLVNIFSSGKSLEAIAIAMLVDQGCLDYDTPIAEYWPEFAQHGKEGVTVADLMRHESGLASFDTSLDPGDLTVGALKENRVGQVIEGQKQKFPKGQDGPREYHAVTRGWIANEVFRRAEPQGRTIGEFLRHEVCGPLEADVFIGVPESELERIRPVKLLSWAFVFLQSLKPKALGRRIHHSFFSLFRRFLKVIPTYRNSTARNAPPPYVGMKGVDFFNERKVAMGETPSAAANGTARGLAKLGAVMSAKGKWTDREYLSDRAWRALHSHPIQSDMGFSQTNFTQGGINLFTAPAAGWTQLDDDLNSGREGFYGWMGLGGSIFQWDPEHEIGFSFVPTALHLLDLFNERGKVYQTEVIRCVEQKANQRNAS